MWQKSFDERSVLGDNARHDYVQLVLAGVEFIPDDPWWVARYKDKQFTTFYSLATAVSGMKEFLERQ